MHTKLYDYQKHKGYIMQYELLITMLSILMLCISTNTQACTGIRLKADDGSIVYARTLEFSQPIESEILFMPSDYQCRGVTAKDSSILKHADKESILTMYQIMKDSHDIFNHYGITYWAAAGTLLGAVRHNGIIPWDVDLDIFMLEESERQLLELEPIFEKLGYTLKRKRKYVYKVISNKKPHRHMDIIFMYHDESQDKTFYSCKQLQKKFNRAGLPLYFETNELYPFGFNQFGDFNIVVPAQSNNYLQCAYGIDYNTHAKSGSKHVLLLDKHRVPARPFGPLKDNKDIIAS
jgi:hypothetical protein